MRHLHLYQPCLLLGAACLTLAAPAVEEPISKARAAVFSGAPLQVETSLGKRMVAELRNAGYEPEGIGIDFLTNQARLKADRYELLMLLNARSLAMASVAPIENYLKAGGDLVALGAPAWETPLFEIQGKWISKESYEKTLSGQKPEHFIERFKDPNLTGWSRSSYDLKTKATYQVAQVGSGSALHVTVPQLTGWDTFMSPRLEHPFPTNHTLTCFRAKGGPRTRQLALEWDEQDGSRWIAVVNLSPEWQQYALPSQAFRLWESPGRGGAGDCFNPAKAQRCSVGLALSHTALQGLEHEYWLAELGTAPNPFGNDAPSVTSPPRLESLSPGYQFFEITTPVFVRADHQKEPLEPWEKAADKGVLLNPKMESSRAGSSQLLGLHPRPRGIGFDQGRPFRWEPLLGAYHRETGEYRGALGALMVHVAPPFRGGVWVMFTPTEEEFYDQPLVTNCLRQVLNRMRRGIFLVEGGGEFFTLFQGQRFRAGTETVNFGSGTSTNLTVSVRLGKEGKSADRALLEETFTLSPGQNKRCEQGGLIKEPTEELVSVVLTSGTQLLDALSHELGVWQAKSNPEFIRAEKGDLWFQGKPWKAHGVNYMPSTGIGIANYHFFEHWVGRGSYDPIVIERDLERIKAMGLNSVSVFIAHESLKAQHLLDFLRRCEKLGLRVNQSLRPGTPMDFRWQEMKELIEYYRMEQNDTIFAYDLAWEPSHSDHNHQQRAYGRLWHDWVLAHYHTAAEAEKVWGVAAPRSSTNNEPLSVPPMAQLVNDGPWRRMAADYRLFLDEELHRHYAEARRLVRSIDRNHAVSFRMQLAGDPTHHAEGLLPYDFYGLTHAVDVWEPEAYGRIGEWEQVKAGEFTAAYARLCDPDKPLVWAEMGCSTWDMNQMAADTEKLAFQARFYSDFYRMLTESGADGVFFWWYPGGFRLIENSDFGIINPDGTDRPVTRIIRELGPEFLKVPKPGKPDYWIAVSRDDDARGLYGIYARAGKEFWAAKASGHEPALKWRRQPGSRTVAPEKTPQSK